MHTLAGMDATSDRVTRLLTLLATLVAVLIVMLALGGAFAYAQYRHLKGQLWEAKGPDLSAAMSQFTKRQEALAARLDKDAAMSRRELEDLRRRRKELEEIPGGPLDKANQAIRLSQLMSDQALLMMDHTIRLQEALAKTARPLEEQRKARDAKQERGR